MAATSQYQGVQGPRDFPFSLQIYTEGDDYEETA